LTDKKGFFFINMMLMQLTIRLKSYN